MEVAAMAGVAPSALRLLGPGRVSKLDARATSHRLSSQFPALHSHSQSAANWHRGEVRASSVREVDKEESPSTPRQRGSRSGSSSSFNMRWKREAPGESGRYTTRSSNGTQTRSGPSNRYDTRRNVQHRAPWEQGGRDRRSAPPVNQVVERRSEAKELEEVNYEDSRSGDGGYQPGGGGQKSAMARIVEKLRAIGNGNSSSSQMEFNKNRPATETSVFLPRLGQAVVPGLDRRWSSADHPTPKRAFDDPEQLTQNARFPWKKDGDEGEEVARTKKVKPPSMAELTMPEPELKRLRTIGL